MPRSVFEDNLEKGQRHEEEIIGPCLVCLEVVPTQSASPWKPWPFRLSRSDRRPWPSRTATSTCTGWLSSSRRASPRARLFEGARSFRTWRSSGRSWPTSTGSSTSSSRTSGAGSAGATSSSGSRRPRLAGCASARGSAGPRRRCCWGAAGSWTRSSRSISRAWSGWGRVSAWWRGSERGCGPSRACCVAGNTAARVAFPQRVLREAQRYASPVPVELGREAASPRQG